MLDDITPNSQRHQHPAVKNYDLRAHIRVIMCGAAPLSHELNEQLFAMFPDAHIGQAYGRCLPHAALA